MNRSIKPLAEKLESRTYYSATATASVAAAVKAQATQAVEAYLHKSSQTAKQALNNHVLTATRPAFTVHSNYRLGVGNPFVRQAILNQVTAAKSTGAVAAPTTALVGADAATLAATYPGDANEDYIVDFNDFIILSNNFGTATTEGVKRGDFNLDGQVEFRDYTLLSNNFGRKYTPPAPTPTPALNPVTVTPKTMSSFTQLGITGTAVDDTVLVTQSGNTLTVTANGLATNYTGSYGNLVIHGGAGNDTITIDPSVNIVTLLYGDAGNDTLINKTSAKATIVDIDSYKNTVAGNGTSTSYWVNPNDVVTASSIEIANLAVNRVANFYQPSTGAVPRDLAGQNLVDPTDGGATHRLTNNSFWGTGPVANDVNQGMLGDCYYLAPLASLANNSTTKFMNTGVDLGDGTYAVRFVRDGVTSFVRVDGDLSNNYYTQVGATGNMWAPIYEKAYAFFRTGANTYASIEAGNPYYSMKDLGFNTETIYANNSSTIILNSINTALNAGRAVMACTQAVKSGAPVIGYHAYSVVGAYRDASGTVMVQLRNPWGVDGAGSDNNINDGLQTLSYTSFSTNFLSLCYGVA